MPGDFAGVGPMLPFWSCSHVHPCSPARFAHRRAGQPGCVVAGGSGWPVGLVHRAAASARVARLSAQPRAAGPCPAGHGAGRRQHRRAGGAAGARCGGGCARAAVPVAAVAGAGGGWCRTGAVTRSSTRSTSRSLNRCCQRLPSVVRHGLPPNNPVPFNSGGIHGWVCSCLEAVRHLRRPRAVRRLHHIGLSGWWVWINLIPMVGPLVLLAMMTRRLEGFG